MRKSIKLLKNHYRLKPKALLFPNLLRESNTEAFTIIELIIVIALAGFLVSLTVPSSQRWVYHENQNSYVRELVGYLNLVRRESRRWGGACSIKLKPLNSSTEGTGLDVTCNGINNATRNNIKALIPSLSKNVFHEISGDFNINPKGQISLVNPPRNVSSIVIVVGGRFDQMSTNNFPKCIVLQAPAGSVRSGIYKASRTYKSSHPGSSYNKGLREAMCQSS